MENEPTVTLAPNAMTTLEDTMERLGIPPEAADTAVKNNIIRLINTSDLPADIVGIVWGIAEQEFSILRNGAQGLAAFSISDVSWTFDKEPRSSWMETLAHYMRW